jgi:hypothetical protein
MDRLNFIYKYFTLHDDECIDITEEQLEEVRKWVDRRSWLEVLNQMDEGLKENLRKGEILTSSTRNKVPIPPPPAMKEVPPPPPPLVHELLP